MNKRLKILLGAAGLLILIVLAGIGYNALKGLYAPNITPQASSSQSSQSAQTSSTFVNKPAPNFSVLDANGKSVSLSDFKGKPVVINFWASWCGPCKSEMPDYQKLYDQYSKQGVVFMMVNLTDGNRETINSAKKYISDNKYTFTAYFDVKSTAANAYGITAIPTSFFIGKDGNIVNDYMSAADFATIQKNIEAIIK